MRKPQVFRSERSFPIVVPDLAPVAEDVMGHFRNKGFEVIGGALASGAWEISIHRGGWVKTTLGTKLALNITIRPDRDSTHVQAGAGVFGRSLVPAAIAWYVTWPALLTRAWGMIRQSRLDDQAIAAVGSSLNLHAKAADQPARDRPQPDRPQADRGEAQAREPQQVRSCTSCDRELTSEAQFCPACGVPTG
jgi:hypothetical protein